MEDIAVKSSLPPKSIKIMARGRSMLRLLVLVALSLLAFASKAEISAETLGHDLGLADQETISSEDAIHFALIAGFIQGAAEMGNRDLMFCLPPGVTSIQLLIIVRTYVAQRQERTADPAIDVVKDGLMSAFPCPTNKP